MSGWLRGYEWLSLAAVGLALSIGCGGSSDRPKVHGQVTLNGEPVKQGEIQLASVEGSESVASGVITAGEYSLASTPGKKRVEIQAYEQQGTKPIDPAMPGSATVPIMKPLLPAKYNSASELTLDVTGDTEQNFELTLP